MIHDHHFRLPYVHPVFGRTTHLPDTFSGMPNGSPGFDVRFQAGLCLIVRILVRLYDDIQTSFDVQSHCGAAERRVVASLSALLALPYKSEMPSALSLHRPETLSLSLAIVRHHTSLSITLKMFFKIEQALVGSMLFLIASTLAQCKNLSSEQAHVTIATSAHISRKNNITSSASSSPEDVSAVNITITAAKPRQEDDFRASRTGSGIRPMHKATPYHASPQQSSADSVIVDVPLAVTASKGESTRTFNVNHNIRYSNAYEDYGRTESSAQTIAQVPSSADVHGVLSSSSAPANPTSVVSSPYLESNAIPRSFPATSRHRHECFWSLDKIAIAVRQHEEAENFHQAEAEKHRLEAFRLTKVALERRGVDGTVGSYLVAPGGEIGFEMRVRQLDQESHNRYSHSFTSQIPPATRAENFSQREHVDSPWNPALVSLVWGLTLALLARHYLLRMFRRCYGKPVKRSRKRCCCAAHFEASEVCSILRFFVTNADRSLFKAASDKIRDITRYRTAAAGAGNITFASRKSFALRGIFTRLFCGIFSLSHPPPNQPMGSRIIGSRITRLKQVTR